MDKPDDQLARRPKPAPLLQTRVIYSSSDHPPQYTVTPKDLGEYAVQWVANEFVGYFSITDLPPHWVAFIQSSIRGGWYEGVYAGVAPFSCVAWYPAPWDDRVTEWIFSQVRLQAVMPIDGGDQLEAADGRDLLALPDQSTV
jgi:hypothetical protein